MGEVGAGKICFTEQAGCEIGAGEFRAGKIGFPEIRVFRKTAGYFNPPKRQTMKVVIAYRAVYELHGGRDGYVGQADSVQFTPVSFESLK